MAKGALSDPYSLLQVSPSADDKAVRAAYRRLAKDCHPDLHPGDLQAEERFKALTQAYHILGDAEKRRLYDLGRIGPDGAARAAADPLKRGKKARSAGGGVFREPFMDESFNDPSLNKVWENLDTDPQPVASDDGFPPFTPSHGSFGPTSGGAAGPGPGEDDLSDLFKEIFRESGSNGPVGGPASARSSLRGRDMRYGLTITFTEAAYGARKRLSLNNGRDVQVVIPPASEHGQVIRLAGQGLAGAAGAPAGDALVKLTVDPHPIFSRQGLDLVATIALTLEQAIVGGQVTLEGLRGPIALLLPSPTQPNQTLTFRGYGLRAGEFQGDLQVTAQLVLPDPVDEALLRFCQKRLT
jgi:DnaJ-class molecular chaperone